MQPLAKQFAQHLVLADHAFGRDGLPLAGPGMVLNPQAAMVQLYACLAWPSSNYQKLA